MVSIHQTPILNRVEARTVRVNGWSFTVVSYPKWAAAVLSALLAACIERSRGHYLNRRGHSSVIRSAFTGMSTELALCLWLKSMGINATMTLPRIGPDEGFDVMIHGQDGAIRLDAKGSLFRDDRWIELLRLGDKFRASARKLGEPDLYAWGIVEPISIQPTADQVRIGLAALLPKHLLHRGRNGLELTFGLIKSIIPQPTPEIFAHAQLKRAAHAAELVQIPHPRSLKPAALIRTLTDELELIRQSYRQRFIADVLLDMELMRQTGRLLNAEPIFHWPIIKPKGVINDDCDHGNRL